MSCSCVTDLRSESDGTETRDLFQWVNDVPGRERESHVHIILKSNKT